jgi:acyl-CoA dehydrogenase
MDFAYDARTEELRARLTAFLDAHVHPAEAVLAEQQEQAGPDGHWSVPPVVAELQAEARRQGLWNLFLPGELGAGLTNLQYAPLAELTGRSPFLAPAALNCAAPDTGNMELLAMFATEAQAEQWLKPLLRAEIRSCFSMTEPAVAATDATNNALTITRHGDS